MTKNDTNPTLNAKHCIFMIPVPIGEQSLRELSNPYYLNIIIQTKIWVVENARTMRRFLSSLKLEINIESLEFFEMNRDSKQIELESYLTTNIIKGNIGVASEAGLPGMADPGSNIAIWGHKNNIEIIPLVGPGSLVLALMASGLNGQQFTFHGYAPIKETELRNFLSDAGKQAQRYGYTQIFIETPYRSDRFLQSLILSIPGDLFICIGYSIHNPGSWVKTKTANEWKKAMPVLGKAPCIFLIGKSHQGLNL